MVRRQRTLESAQAHLGPLGGGGVRGPQDDAAAGRLLLPPARPGAR
ncbi:hypothetical protein [Curtobacterium sp. MCJR17_043]|nr:hypothetical protein [Curtobacterium sp. MCJR17_043]WIB36767.1 hypothetical protein DEJ15_07005 [Curtobacterium sp. MCJR17_043]